MDPILSAPPSSLRPPGPSVLGRILTVVFFIGFLSWMVFSITEGTANSRFLQMGASVGLLVLVATLVDVTLGLAFLILCISFSPEVSFGGLDQLRLEDFIVPPLLLAWLLRMGQAREAAVPIPFSGLATAYLGAMLLSSLAGFAAGTAQAAQALTVMAKYVEYFLILMIVANNVRTSGEFRALLIFTLGVAVAGAGFTYAGTLGGGGKVAGPSGETATIYGGFLAMMFCLALGVLLHARTAGAKLVSSAALLVMGIGILHTYSRTTYMALGSAVGIFALLRERRILPLILLLAIFLPFLMPETVVERMSTIGGLVSGKEPASWTARTSAWEMTVNRMAGSALFWGEGAGSVRLGDVDNEYVRVLADLGILGLAVFVALLARIGWAALRHYDRLDMRGLHKGFAAGYLMGFMALAVHAIGATSFTAIRTMETFMVLTGLFVAQSHRAPEWELKVLMDRGEAPPAGPSFPYRM